MASRSLHARAYAKLNLALSVGPPLPKDRGGYHPIASWFSAIDLWDDLHVEALADGEPSRYEIQWAEDAARPSPIDWPLEKDLAVRAHRLLEELAGRALPVALRMRKRIPVGGGLGGGSSDAAAMLRAMDLLFGLDLGGSARLSVLSTALGSDVAYFIDGPIEGPPRPAIVTGLGASIERVGFVGAEVLLILPAFGCPTGAVYRAFDQSGPGPLRTQQVEGLVRGALERGRIDSGELFNDLAGPAASVAPGLREIQDRASRVLGTPVHVTGSGSTLFAVLEGGRPGAESLGEALRAGGVEAAALLVRLVQNA